MKELKALRMLADVMNYASGQADIEGITMETPGEPVEVSYYVHAETNDGRIFDIWFYEDQQSYEVHESTGREFLLPISAVASMM